MMLGAAPFTQTQWEIEIDRRGGKLEIDAEIVPPFRRQMKPHGQVITKTNLCSHWQMSQIQSRREILHVNTIE